MAKIDISNLDAIGSDLFGDRESFLNELSENYLEVVGGFEIYKFPIPPTTWPLPTPFPIDPYPNPTLK